MALNNTHTTITETTPQSDTSIGNPRPTHKNAPKKFWYNAALKPVTIDNNVWFRYRSLLTGSPDTGSVSIDRIPQLSVYSG